LIVGIGNRYPRQLLNKAVHKVLFCDYTVKLQKVIKTDDVYKIETILKKRKKGRRVQYLVKWLGYPESFNRWIFKQDLQKRGVALGFADRTRSPGENLHDLLCPFLPYSLLDTADVWLAHVTSAGGIAYGSVKAVVIRCDRLG
jgi:hypothetical protein